jgi:membrane-bound ClpP family serine protease
MSMPLLLSYLLLLATLLLFEFMNPVISAVGLLLSTLMLLIFFHLLANAFSSTVMLFKPEHKIKQQLD